MEVTKKLTFSTHTLVASSDSIDGTSGDSRSMVNGMVSEAEISALDQIREAEATAAGSVAAAREAAASCLEEARIRGEAHTREAQGAGQREGTVRYEEEIAVAQKEAGIIRRRAEEQAAVIQRDGTERMAAAVCFALDVVLGLEGGRDAD